MGVKRIVNMQDQTAYSFEYKDIFWVYGNGHLCGFDSEEKFNTYFNDAANEHLVLFDCPVNPGLNVNDCQRIIDDTITVK
jgi:hypothetical protein